MSWFAAHLILYVKFKEHPQKQYPVWENIVLLKAASEDDAWAKAERRGREDEGDEGGSFRWDGKLARWVFAGVRKLTRCEDPDRRPDDGTEISYTAMRLNSEDAVHKLVEGEPVPLVITETFSD